MKRWDCKAWKLVDRPDLDAFLADILAVCKKHGLSLSHEDGQGGFIIEPWSEDNARCLKDASIGHEVSKEPMRKQL